MLNSAGALTQWGIEAVRHIRDLAVNTLRDAGHRNIAPGLREVSYTPFTRPLDFLGLSLTCDAA
ncbi:hypothetical protein [Streptomyces sp. NPDC001774]